MDHLLARNYFEAGFPLRIAEVSQSAIAAHSHEFFEMVYVRRGHGAHYIEGVAYPIRAGDLYVISPGETHFYAPVAGSTLSIVNVLWMPQLVEELLRASSLDSLRGAWKLLYIEPLLQRAERSADGPSVFAHRLHLAGRAAYRIESLLDEMRREQLAAAAGCEVLLRHLFCALLVLLSRAHDAQRSGDAREADSQAEIIAPGRRVVARAVEYLEAHHAQRVRVAEVAAHANISAGRLAHLFKEHAGCGLIEYLHEFRIARACAALLADDAPISHVAAAVGYDDLRFFNRAFRKRTGCAPTEYRRFFKSGENAKSTPE